MRTVAKKALGQHFLTDRNLLAVIAELAALEPSDVVLEVGPGLGILTRYLAERVAHVHAIELDRSLEPALRDIPRLSLRFGDALALDIASLDPPPRKLVANLPYNIATPLLVESLDTMPTVERWCVMVQREVADRLFASPGTKAYGAVSVLMQLASERVGFHPVSREVFRPRPNVESALVAFTRSAAGLPPGIKQLVEGAFSHRRKTLANALSLAGVCTRERAQQALAQLGLDPSLRAEALEPRQFVTLGETLATRRSQAE
jgi:16S rRNA (adenine1518-N6/adenine1519-N6)-dimethyltransferase